MTTHPFQSRLEEPVHDSMAGSATTIFLNEILHNPPPVSNVFPTIIAASPFGLHCLICKMAIGCKSIYRHLRQKHPTCLTAPSFNFAKESRIIIQSITRLKAEAKSLESYLVGSPCMRFNCNKCSETYSEKKNATRHVQSTQNICTMGDISQDMFWPTVCGRFVLESEINGTLVFQVIIYAI